MGTNERNRNPRDGRAPRRNSARLEADYRQEMRKAAEERVRARQAQERRSQPAESGQSATQSRYREDYRERNRSAQDPRFMHDEHQQTGRRAAREAYGEPHRGRNSRRGAEDARSRSRSRQLDDMHPDDTGRRQRTRTQMPRDDRGNARGQRPASSRDAAAGRNARPGQEPRRNDARRRPDGDRRRQSRGRQDSRRQQRGMLMSPRVIIAIVAVIAALIFATLGVRLVVSVKQSQPESPLPPIEQQIAQRVSAYRLPESEIAARFEALGVDDTWAEQAASLAQDDYRYMVMAQRSEALGVDGEEVANKLVKLAVSEPEAIDYVYGFLDRYPQEHADRYTDSVTKGVIPQIYQWDERWGYTVYSGSAFGCNGCGPTSLAMVYAGLTGNNDMSPADMAQLAADGGYETEYDGTINQFFVDAAAGLGLDVIELDVDYDALVGALEAGMPVICNVGPGDFTLTGHFFVITGVNDDGTLAILDPFSSVNSSQSWDVNLILNQTIALYAYSETASDDEDADDAEGEDAEGGTDDESQEVSDEAAPEDATAEGEALE